MGIESGVNRIPVCAKHKVTQEALDALCYLHPDLFSIGGDEQLSQQAGELFDALQACPDCRAVQDARFIRNSERDGESTFADSLVRVTNTTRSMIGRDPLSTQEEAELRAGALAESRSIKDFGNNH